MFNSSLILFTIYLATYAQAALSYGILDARTFEYELVNLDQVEVVTHIDLGGSYGYATALINFNPKGFVKTHSANLTNDYTRTAIYKLSRVIAANPSIFDVRFDQCSSLTSCTYITPALDEQYLPIANRAFSVEVTSGSFRIREHIGGIPSYLDSGDVTKHVHWLPCDGTDCPLTYGALVPIPAAVWLMGSGLLGLIGFSRKSNPIVVTG